MAGSTTKPAAKGKASTPAPKPAAKGKATTTAKGKPATATAATGAKTKTPLKGGIEKMPAAASTAKAKGRGS